MARAAAQSAAAKKRLGDMRAPTWPKTVLFPDEGVILMADQRLFMNKSLLALSLMLIAQSSLGAVEYDFRQSSSSQIESVPSSDFTGHAVIDGARYRVDFRTGDFAHPGVYFISTHGSKNQVWVDPNKKAY